MIDPNNPVVALCAAGIAIDGDASAARTARRRRLEDRGIIRGFTTLIDPESVGLAKLS